MFSLSILHPLSFILLFILLCFAGCRQDLETEYGQRSGPGATASVNGTGGLGAMFETAGHKVVSAAVLSPRLRHWANCIVWFPDDFRPPSEKVRKWLDEWLAAAADRTLIYVGRDFDAACWYWKKILPLTPAAQKELVRRRLEDARTWFKVCRAGMPESADGGDWFTFHRGQRGRSARSPATSPGWPAWTRRRWKSSWPRPSCPTARPKRS